jgi:hypothetical protein
MKQIASVLLWLILLLPLGGCTQKIRELVGGIQFPSSGETEEDYAYEENALKVEADTVYHNGYLGFSYTLPRGWWLYTLNADNFSEDPGDTSDPDIMDISYGEDSSSLDLISFANLQFSTQDNHLGFNINAESIEGVRTIEAYMEAFEEYMLEPVKDTEYFLLDSDRLDIKGVSYEKRIFKVDREEADFNILTLTRPVKQGYYLTIMVNYWPLNKNAEQAVIGAVTKALS